MAPLTQPQVRLLRKTAALNDKHNLAAPARGAEWRAADHLVRLGLLTKAGDWSLQITDAGREALEVASSAEDR